MDHFEHVNGLAIISSPIISKVELDLTLIFFSAIPTSLSHTKEKVNLQKERRKI